MIEQTANPALIIEALSGLELTGRARTHVQDAPELGCLLHPAAATALLTMRAAAARDGINLQPISGFRDFDQQLTIWNGKFRGDRVLLGGDSQPVNAAALDESARVAAILVWSALPGASRHHWGSDCDLIDGNSLPAGMRVELLSADYAPGGRYARLSAWLAIHAHAYGFFFPYDRDRGGVQPEPWHLSFAPVADAALTAMNVALLVEALTSAAFAGRATVLPQISQLFARYVASVATAPCAALAAVALSRAARLA